jgi:hypothetical protein
MAEMINQRMRIIQKLKKNLEVNQTELGVLVRQLGDNKGEDLRTRIAEVRGTIAELKKQLEATRMNKNLSSHFKWEPHAGMNRSQAKAFRRERYGK